MNIRGSLIGTSTALGTVGMFLFSVFGGFIYDFISKKAPFLIVGVLDFCFIVFLCFLQFTGRLKEKRKDES